MHLRAWVSIEVSDIALLDDAHEDSVQWRICDGEDVNLGESILHLGDTSVDDVSSEGLLGTGVFLFALLCCIALLAGLLDCDLVLIVLVVPSLACEYFDLARNLSIDLAEIDVSTVTWEKFLSVGHGQAAWVDFVLQSPSGEFGSRRKPSK